ncbi:cysteine dioxygenase type 1-like isoform X2 [Oscarella lobularis]|uniref:cysteine dioxygenase type 1-like isoform X2 n=1 Tax=Oscarella lobularis TaxID=121494 RepID=UPI00331410A2
MAQLRTTKPYDFTPPKDLDGLIAMLHEALDGDEADVNHISAIMESYRSNDADWSKYVQFDKHKYTRHLVDRGNGKFNLILLCWAEGQGSCIHDHPDSHCFMKILDGQLHESKYEWPEKGKEMTLIGSRPLEKESVAYINDSLGLHRIENKSHTTPAISLHLYSPPFQMCRSFDQRSGKETWCKMTFTSQMGIKCSRLDN